MNRFEQAIRRHGRDGLGAGDIRVLQANLGFLCNLQCRHCHVEGSPERLEVMSGETAEQVLAALRQLPGVLLDLTGGAPELNPGFRHLVTTAREDNHPVQVRTNLAVLFEPGMEDLPRFFREHEVQLVASLPCYLAENVCAQRGSGVYQRAVEAIRTLNALGYGTDPALPLDLVYNPGGPFLPPDQLSLESDYRRELAGRFGVRFNRLLTIANMPIGRFLEDLEREGKAEEYSDLLEASFNSFTLDGLMCRHQVAVGWDGTLYDCDFNLA
ncbi:MAG TPA: arsenosugar biosynthesis radical SAM (seleno)protein ArsS, partial [Deferrisomatales bacterium]|nr:arsenosugar biosynthesis radical SAM (seleno)protein ArsS [Deferrisomatales bacterium]